MASKRIAKNNSKTNFNDVLVKLIDAVYNLVNTGNIVGVLLLYVCVQAFYISQKVSQNVIDDFVMSLLAIDYFYMLPLMLALLVSMFANYFQHKTYKERIADLITIRHELIHGLSAGDLENIKKHSTSGVESMESDGDC